MANVTHLKFVRREERHDIAACIDTYFDDNWGSRRDDVIAVVVANVVSVQTLRNANRKTFLQIFLY